MGKGKQMSHTADPVLQREAQRVRQHLCQVTLGVLSVWWNLRHPESLTLHPVFT